MTERHDATRARWTAMQAALADPKHLFTRDQVHWLMRTAARWEREALEGEASPETYQAGWLAGYNEAVAEINSKKPVAVRIGGQWMDQADERRRADARGSMPRTNDYMGGPVDWDTSTPIRSLPTPALPEAARHTNTYSMGSAA